MNLRPRFGFLFALVAIAAFLLSAGPLLAQVDVTTGRISGQVVDDTGAPLPGASIEAKSLATGQTLIQVTDSRGLYRIVNAQVGPWDITASLSGFQPQTRKNIVVTLGAAITMDFRLQLAGIKQEMIITAEAPVVETSQTASETTVDNKAIRSLPSNGRNFTDFVLLTPNAQKDPSRGNIQIAGQRGIDANITLDGVDFNNAFFGGAAGAEEGRSPFQVSQESVREFQVIQNGASVEFGRSGGGFVNVITKSGTNEFHGSGFFYDRPQSLVAKFSDGSNPRDQQTKQYGLSFGGPIMRDKLFFFGSFDHQDQTTTQPVNAAVTDPDIGARYPALASAPDYAWQQNGRLFFARLDLQASDRQRVLVRGNFLKYDGDNGSRIGSQYSSTYNGLEGDTTNSYVGQWNSQWSSSFLNDLTAQYASQDGPRQDKAPTLTEVQYGPSNRYGGVSFLPISAFQKRATVGDTATYLLGAHAIKMGGEYNWTNMEQVFKGNWRGVFVFSGSTSAILKANLLAGKWSQYRQFFGVNGLTADEAGQYNKAQKELAFFAQDQWFVLPNLTVTLGVRYERQNNPNDPILNLNSTTLVNPADPTKGFTYNLNGQIPDANDQWSPRLSIAYSPEKSGKSVVRLSLGRYWIRTPAIIHASLYTSNGLVGTQYIINAGGSSDNPAAPSDPVCAQTTCPGWGAAFNPVGVAQIGALPPGTKLATPGISVIDPNFKNPHTDKISLGLEREFFGVALGAEGQFAKTYNLERIGDPNLQISSNPAVDCPGLSPEVTCNSRVRPNPAYARVTTYYSDARGQFESVSFTARKNFSNGLRAFGSVTWAEDKDNDSNERNFNGFFAEDLRNLDGSYSWSARDIRWRMVTNVSYDRNISKVVSVFTSATYRYQTGLPYTASAGSDLNRDGDSTTDRATSNGVHFARDSFRQPDFSTFDARLGFGFELGPGKLSVFAEIFNLFNVKNTFVSGIPSTSTWGTGNSPNPTFGIPTGVYSTPRTVQLAGRYDF